LNPLRSGEHDCLLPLILLALIVGLALARSDTMQRAALRFHPYMGIPRQHGAGGIDLHKRLPTTVKHRVVQPRDLVDATATKMRIHSRQHPDRKLA
jgi:hypothetical protein